MPMPHRFACSPWILEEEYHYIRHCLAPISAWIIVGSDDEKYNFSIILLVYDGAVNQ